MTPPAEVSSLPELSEVLENSEIDSIMTLVRKNGVLAEILGDQHTTQPFPRAEDLASAFQGKLIALDPAFVKKSVRQAKEKYAALIEEYGITEQDLVRLFEKVWVYSRLTNPMNELLEESLSAMEKTEKTAVFASGLAAINAAVRQFVKPAQRGPEGEYKKGGKIVVIGSIYGGTYAQLMHTCKETGREFQHLPLSDFIEQGLPDDTSAILFETSNNPTLNVVPIDRVVAEAKRVSAVTICDNTFTPLTVCPAEKGIDLTVNSLTKYHGGKSEDLGGSISGKAELVNQVMDIKEGIRMLEGGVMAPRVAKEFLGNLRDLPERLFKSTQNARGLKAVARAFGLDARGVEEQEAYRSVRRKGIPDSLANGMVALRMPTLEQARAFVNAMIAEGVGFGAVSLGAVGTYYSIPSETTHSEMPEEEQRKAGITPGLVRISCGIELDLVEKVRKVLAKLFPEKVSAMA